MHKRMGEALLQMYRNLEEAGERQSLRGVHDQGARTQVTGGRHMDVVADVIRVDLIGCGFLKDCVYYHDGPLGLPGWFRPSKDWDLLAFDGGNLLAAVELKSINSSFGKNINNRTEEALGSATDAAYAIRNSLIPFRTVPPLLGFAIVVRLCKESREARAVSRSVAYPADSAFQEASYLERLSIMCRRLLAERLYQAVWIVGVDPENRIVLEPEPDLTYEKFITAIQSQLRIHRA